MDGHTERADSLWAPQKLVFEYSYRQRVPAIEASIVR